MQDNITNRMGNPSVTFLLDNKHILWWMSPSAWVLPMVVAVGKEKMTAGVLEVPDTLAGAEALDATAARAEKAEGEHTQGSSWMKQG